MHPTSHLYLHEEQAYADLLDLVPLLAGEKSRPLVAVDIK